MRVTRDGPHWVRASDTSKTYFLVANLVDLGQTPHLPTTNAVPIPPEEAGREIINARLEGRYPNLEVRRRGSECWAEVVGTGWDTEIIVDAEWRIPAIPQPATKQVVIEVAADVELPGSFTIYPNEAGYFVISDNPKGVPAKVVKP